VPEDRSLAGYDDIPFTRSSVPLTSVGRPHIRMGAEAANLHRPLRRVRRRDVDPPEDQPADSVASAGEGVLSTPQ
jgi:DNA-binding LacI/PurR family transcriptional regulator